MAKRKIMNQDELNNLINDYSSGESLRSLAIEYNCTRSVLSRILKENNIVIRDNTKNSRKYYHDEDFFEKINTEEKAYWLGFIFADGFIESKRNHGAQKLGITLSKIDINHLEKFKADIKATNPIKEYKGSGYNANGTFSKILLTSQKTVDDLKKHGCTEHKTLKLTFPTIKDELKHHFIRGYMDGDGSISLIQNKSYIIQFTGTKDFLTSIMKYFNKNLAMYTKDNITYELKFGGNLQVKKILNILYKDATVYLDRKYNKYLEVLKYTER